MNKYHKRLYFIYLQLILVTILIYNFFSYKSFVEKRVDFSPKFPKSTNLSAPIKDMDLQTMYRVIDSMNIGPKFNDSNQLCNIPLYINELDDSAKEYMYQEQLNCPVEPQLTFVDEDGVLRMNASSEMNCFYAFMKRQAHDQENQYFGDQKIPETGAQLPNDKPFVKVYCTRKGSNEWIYENTHLRIPEFKSNEAKVTTPSVLIVVIESLSRLSYYRYMKKTKEAVDSMGHLQIMEGLTKIGRNSFPNSFGFLAGKAMQDEDCQSVQNWDNKFTYLWDEFKKPGYVTAFTEDMVQAGLFTYYSSGFIKQPTDWFPSPFWVNMYPGEKNWGDIWQNPKQYCYAKVGPKSDIFLDQVARFHKFQLKHKTKYFMYSFYSQSCHEEFNSFQYVDQSLATFIHQVKHHLKDTILILMGDHGTMHGAYSEVPLGHMEGSLPFFGIRIPETLHQKYPYLRPYLESNRRRLISWWDVRKMVQDVAKGTFQTVDPSSSDQSKPLSPWREVVSLMRTCEDAAIPEQWCVCNGVLGQVAKREDYYSNFVQSMIELLNQELIRYACKRVSLIEVMRINHVFPRKDENIALKEYTSLLVKLASQGSILEDDFGFKSAEKSVQVFLICVRTRRKIGDKWKEWSLYGEETEKGIDQLCKFNTFDKVILIN